MTEQRTCPHCGKQLHADERINYAFTWWATSLAVFIISLMLLALDLVDDGQGVRFRERVDWSPWAILGLWLVFISVQLIRYQPNYEWLMIPAGGLLISGFLAGVDLASGDNEGFAYLDWAWFAIIPIITFIVILPITARISRKQPTPYDRLDYLVDHLIEEQS